MDTAIALIEKITGYSVLEYRNGDNFVVEFDDDYDYVIYACGATLEQARDAFVRDVCCHLWQLLA